MNVVDMNSIVMIDIENEDEVIRVQEKSGISLYELAEKYYKSKYNCKYGLFYCYFNENNYRDEII